MTLVSDIRNIEMCSELTDAEVEALASVAEERQLPANTVVFREGDIGKEIYVVKSGRVAMEIEIHQGKFMQVVTAEPGQGFAWSALLPDSRMTATARCTEDSIIIAMNIEKLEPLIKLDAHLGYVLLRAVAGMMSRRLRQTRMQLASCYYG